MKRAKASSVRSLAVLDVREAILAAIQRGEFIEKLPSEPKLAERFGVPRPTVAAALNYLAAAGLLERRHGSGTYLKHPATRRSLAFELLLPDSVNLDFFTPLGNALATELATHGHRLLWPKGFAPTTIEEATGVAERLAASDVSGVFFVPIEFAPNSEALNDAIVKGLKALPVVLLDRCMYSFPRRSDFDVIGIDNRRAGYILTDHLLRKHECRRIAFVRRQDSASTVDARVAGFEEAVRDAGSGAQSKVVTGEPAGLDFVESLLSEFQPDAVVCANDTLAKVFLQTLDNVGRQEKGRPMVAGFDGLAFSEALGLTTIRQPLDAIGTAAAAAIIERLATPSIPARDILLNFELKARASCCSPQRRDSREP